MKTEQLDLFAKRQRGASLDEVKRLRSKEIAKHEMAKMRAILNRKRERAELACA